MRFFAWFGLRCLSRAARIVTFQPAAGLDCSFKHPRAAAEGSKGVQRLRSLSAGQGIAELTADNIVHAAV